MSKKIVKGVKYSKHEVMKLVLAFKEMDADGKGFFRESDVETQSEHQAAQADVKSISEGRIPVLHVKQFRVQGREVVRSMDADGDGKVSWNDMLRTFFPNANAKELKQMHAWAYPIKDAVPEATFELSKDQLEEIARLFNLNDKNKDGKIDVREFTSYCQVSGYDMEEVEALFVEADFNKDGVISFDEFIDMVKSAYLPLDFDAAY